MAKKSNKQKHKITTRQTGGGVPVARVYRSLIRQAVLMTLKSEAVAAQSEASALQGEDKAPVCEACNLPCAVGVIITDDKTIRDLNLKHRGLDKATDVLSFPLQEFDAKGFGGLTAPDIDLDTQALPLGDIVLSLDTIKRNARRYKHPFEQETVRMIVHSTLHLLGYDHGETMQSKEETLMQDMGYFNQE